MTRLLVLAAAFLVLAAGGASGQTAALLKHHSVETFACTRQDRPVQTGSFRQRLSSFDLMIRTGAKRDWDSYFESLPRDADGRINSPIEAWVFKAYGDLSGLEIWFWEKRPVGWVATGGVALGPAGAREGIAIVLTSRTDTEYALDLACRRDDGAPPPIVTVSVPPFPVVAYSRRAPVR